MKGQMAGRVFALEGNITVEVLSERVNPLINRRELEATIIHPGQGTPKIPDLRMSVARALGVDYKLVYIRRLLTETGSDRSRASIHVYKTIGEAQEYEPKHVKEKNKTLAEEIEEAELEEKKKSK